MLSSEYIHEKILDTTSCTSEDVRKLAELMELYPYVSSFPILYLKALANSKDVRLESEIEKYAYRISSRAVLFELLNPRFEAEIAPETQAVIQEEVKNPIQETIEVEEERVPVVQAEIVEEIEKPVVETIEVEEEIVPEEKNEDFQKENDQLEQLIQAAAISSSFMETNFHEEEKETKLEPEIEKTPDSEFVAEKKIEKITILEKTEIEPKSERSFSSWLSFGATKELEKATPAIEEKTTEIEPEPKKTEYYNFDKPKKEFYSPVKKAKESLSENNMPVSETLAKIFALQGNYPKSIYVYEQLILIFPEKKSFFATQIKNLKKKLNS